MLVTPETWSELTLTDLQPVHQDNIRKVIEELLEDKTFVAYFFSTNFPEWRLAAEVLLQLMGKVSFVSRSIDSLWNLLGITDFQDYLANSSMSTNQDLVCFFVGEIGNSQQVQQNIYEHIKSYDTNRRCRIIRLLRKIIKDEAIKKDLIKYISEHFDDLDRYDIIDFAFCGWLSISPKQSNSILEEAIRLKKAEIPGMHSYPDPFESQLELICLLYITEVIKDISLLQPISKESEFLMFFFDDPSFDYSKIDFTHYMWGNIIRTPRFTEHIKNHKEAIIPVIQKRIDIDVATEFERKLLYGILMDNVF